MKKTLFCLLIIIIGTIGVYYALTYVNKDKKVEKDDTNKTKVNDNNDTIPSRDAFISEAIKLQTLAENKGNNETCKCYNIKELDRNSSLSGSILVYTVDDLFISTMWLSNGYYLLDGYEAAASGNLTESSEQASIYCGEENSSTQSNLCATNY